MLGHSPAPLLAIDEDRWNSSDMRVLCGDYYPVLQGRPIPSSPDGTLKGPRANAPCTNPNHVHLSWARIAKSSGTMEVVAYKTDPYYRLYEDCISYLRTKYPVSSLTCSLPNKIGDDNGLARLHPSFGTLVNLLADRYPRPDLENLPPEGLRVNFRRNSVLDFILSGMLAVVVTLKYHVACALRESPGDTPESDLYQALFLDCITALWSYECYLRAGTAEWSPMPWSRASLRELPADGPIPEPPSFITPTLSIDDLVDEDSSTIRVARGLVGSPMDIPWFGAPHDGYPFCRTLASYTKIRRDGALQSLRDDAALWVSALTFGLLEAVTRARISESMLIVPGPNEGTTVISGTRILQFLVHWHQHMHQHAHAHDDEDTHLEHGREVARLLTRAFNALDEEEWQNASMFLRAGFRTTEVTDMVCAVALTVVPLCGIAHSTWATLPEIELVLDGAGKKLRNFYTATLGSCENRMYRAGWCPNTISHQFMSTLRGLPIVSNLVRLPPYIRSSPDEHKRCTEAACELYTITNTAAYVPCHAVLSCRCEHLKPPLEDVIRLLSAKRVPAVILDGNQLLVRPADECSYVAISHVWADGMGSITEDGLPACMVERIAGLVQRLHPESGGAFWMDSLCVPDVKCLRKRAIKLMAQTYRDATKVLVIDNCIRSQCSESKPWEENLFRIATSGWVRRVWTLQEGLLARELYFEFIEGPVNVSEKLGFRPYGPDTTPNSSDQHEFLAPESCSSHVPVLAFRAQHHGCTHHLELDDVIRLLRLRTTTKPEDELIAVSTLLHINLDALLAVKAPDLAQGRVQEFFLQQREVSLELPTQITPRLALPNFAWAPRTLVSCIEGASLNSGTGLCTANGLTAEYFVADFEKPAPVVVESGKGEQGEMRILISHRASMATYMLRLYVGMSSASVPVIDALLFLEGDLSDTQTTLLCAAVCNPSHRGEREGVDIEGQAGPVAAGVANSSKDQAPRPFSYVAPGRLHRMALHPNKFVVDDMSMMGELRQMTVLLM